MLALLSADRYLIPFGATFIDAQDADIPDMVMPACVHATGDIQVELADVVQVVEVVETLLNRLRNRDRLGVRK